MDTHVLSLLLAILGTSGILFLLGMTGRIYWRYRDCPMGSYRWHMRNIYLKQIAALACMFSLAMAASYLVIAEAWAFLYCLIALKTGSTWLRLAVLQRT